MVPRAFVGAAVFDGKRLLQGHAVVIRDGAPSVVALANLPANCTKTALDGGTLMPGFVDLQVNGGGGVMFNDDPTVRTLRTIANAHTSLGTRAFLPTLITDTPAKTTAAIDGAQSAIQQGVPGIIGLHLEGPHLCVARKGAHDARLIRPMTDPDLQELIAAASALPNLMVTVAPENVTAPQISALAAAGAMVFLGHSDADYGAAQAAFAAGARGTTHLFNAMSQLGSRAPGLVGATLDTPTAFAGLIADGVHVHPATIRAALNAKSGSADIFLVTDSMACAGSNISQFKLGNRTILRNNGRLTLEDGTLAGADLEMAQALRVMIKDVGEEPANAFARATSIPAAILRDPLGVGTWPAHVKNLIYLSDDFSVQAASDLI
jgi:N-acetylglucosamine-6-phosphate deacetylase